MKWYMRACPACGGDLHDSTDRGWVECLMCSRSFRASEIVKQPLFELVAIGAGRHEPKVLSVPKGIDHERRAA
jgi:hypothetical protein